MALHTPKRMFFLRLLKNVIEATSKNDILIYNIALINFTQQSF